MQFPIIHEPTTTYWVTSNIWKSKSITDYFLVLA